MKATAIDWKRGLVSLYVEDDTVILLLYRDGGFYRRGEWTILKPEPVNGWF